MLRLGLNVEIVWIRRCVHRLYDFVFVVESRRATTLRCIRSLWLSLFEIDFRMVIFGVWKINDCVCCRGE